jgi:hypothetical protein
LISGLATATALHCKDDSTKTGFLKHRSPRQKLAILIVRVLIILIHIGVPLAILYGLWKLLRTKWAFTIEVDETGVRSHEGIRTHHQRRLLELLQKTPCVEGPMKIMGRYDETGRLQLRFRGNASDNTKQQIRNFIVNEL